MDVGCGTGRIASMLAQSPHVKHINAYDNALPMLQRCVVNVVKSVSSSSTHHSLSVCKEKDKENVNK